MTPERYLPPEAVGEPETTKKSETIDPLKGNEVLKIGDVEVVIPDNPWLPTHGGLELRVGTREGKPLVPSEGLERREIQHELAEMGKVAVVAAEAAKPFAEADNPEQPDWYDKPWFNLNFNSQIGGQKFCNLNCQVFLRPRTLGQTRGMRRKAKYNDPTDRWSSPYWAVPVPVDYPLNPDDRGPYPPAQTADYTAHLGESFETDQDAIEGAIKHVRVFTDAEGKSTLDHDFDFKVYDWDFPVWQKGDYMLVTQINPLVDRRDGVHFVLIYRGEQQGPEERYSYHWRDPRLIAEMAMISSAVTKIICGKGYGGRKFDRSYIHLNANWSLSKALPDEERREGITDGLGDMDFGSFGPGKFPGPSSQQNLPGPNTHPHIQLLAEGSPDFDVSLSPEVHRGKNHDRQTDAEIAELRSLFESELTPLLISLQGKTLEELS